MNQMVRRGILSLLLLAVACSPKVMKVEKKQSGLNKTPERSLFVLKPKVNVRKGPSTSFPVLATLNDGDEVVVSENVNGWYKIRLEGNKTGFIRSDMLGPRSCSRMVMAAAFNDSVMPAFPARLFIDEHNPYRIIYLQFTNTGLREAKTLARKIGRAFQQKVYPGALTIRLLKEGDTIPMDEVHLTAIEPVVLPPLLPMGILHSFSVKEKHLKIEIDIWDNPGKETLLSACRKISSQYDYPIDKSIIRIKKRPENTCLIIHVEDTYGERYWFDRCDPLP